VINPNAIPSARFVICTFCNPSTSVVSKGESQHAHAATLAHGGQFVAARGQTKFGIDRKQRPFSAIVRSAARSRPRSQRLDQSPTVDHQNISGVKARGVRC
jgi:hypothetical protein